MYGAVLPVIAIDYKSIRESVEENVTGRIFTDENDLFKILKEIIVDFNGKNEILKRYKSNIRLKRESNTWMDQWNKKVLPIFQRISNGYPLTRKNSSGKKETRKKSKQEKITDLQKKLEENVEKAQHNLLYNELRSDDSQLQYMGLIGEPQTSILQDEDKQNLNKRHP